mgnify:FL=1
MQNGVRKNTVVGKKSVKWQNTGPNNCRFSQKVVRNKTVLTEIMPHFEEYTDRKPAEPLNRCYTIGVLWSLRMNK